MDNVAIGPRASDLAERIAGTRKIQERQRQANVKLAAELAVPVPEPVEPADGAA